VSTVFNLHWTMNESSSSSKFGSLKSPGRFSSGSFRTLKSSTPSRKSGRDFYPIHSAFDSSEIKFEVDQTVKLSGRVQRQLYLMYVNEIKSEPAPVRDVWFPKK